MRKEIDKFVLVLKSGEYVIIEYNAEDKCWQCGDQHFYNYLIKPLADILEKLDKTFPDGYYPDRV